jgi:hypothetical protein
MIPYRPDRVPDSIEPLVGYRAWYVAGASLLLPISHRDPATTTSPWDGANRGWVSATCSFGTPEPVTDSMRKRLEHIYAKLGLPFESIPDGPHTVPGEHCACGFYAMKALSCAQQLTMELRFGPDLTLGRVELAGKVIEHTLGYRAARARIAALIPIRGNERTVKRLAQSLGLPLDPAILRWSGPDGLTPAA